MSFRPFLTALVLLAFPAPAVAHMVITSPPPRVDAANIKEASAPCGGPRGDTITQLQGGQMLTLEYDETIAHPGHFELNFSMAGDANWTAMAENIPDGGGVGSYSYTFEVPDVDCTDCTFQFVQVMTDRNPPTNYYSCIDVEITSSMSGNNTAAPDAGTPDMGSTLPPDMGTTPTNNAAGNNTAGNNSTTATNGMTTIGPGGSTNTGTDPDNSGYEGPYENPPPAGSGSSACTTAHHHQSGGLLGLLGLISALFLLRRRTPTGRLGDR